MEYESIYVKPDWMSDKDYEALLRIDLQIRLDYVNPIRDDIERQEDSDGI
jgi:hypothetical protein